MFCTGCGTQSADSEVFCGGCGVARQQATGTIAPPAKAVFHLGEAMKGQAMPGGVKGRPWGAYTVALIALVTVCLLIAAT